MKKQIENNNNFQSIKNHQEPPRGLIQSIIDTFANGQKKEAIIEIEALIKDYPLAPLLLNISGTFYKSNGQLDFAATKFEQALSQSKTMRKLTIILELRFVNLAKLKKLLKVTKMPLALKMHIQMRIIILAMHY